MIKAAVEMQAGGEALSSSASALSYGSPVQQERRLLSPTGKFVLVIDGSPTIQKVIEVTLRREGYEVCSFRDGIDAMRWFAKPQARTPDLMLVDLDLPKLDGYHVIQKFKTKARFAHTACLVLCEPEKMAQTCLERMAWAATSLPKPFTIKELVAAVHTSIADRFVYFNY